VRTAAYDGDVVSERGCRRVGYVHVDRVVPGPTIDPQAEGAVRRPELEGIVIREAAGAAKIDRDGVLAGSSEALPLVKPATSAAVIRASDSTRN
jgi:hypothetical protein